jgi:hypothetical protein
MVMVFGTPFNQVAPLDLHRQRLVQRKRRAQVDLDLFRRPFADQQVIFPLQIIHDGFVHLVPGHPYRPRIDDARQRNHRDIRGPAANIHHHVAARLGDGQPAPIAATMACSTRNTSLAFAR